MEKPESVRDSLNQAIEEHKEDAVAPEAIYKPTEQISVRDSLEASFDELKDTNKLAEKASKHIDEQKDITREARGEPKPEPKPADLDRPESIPVKVWDHLSEPAREYYRKEFRELAATKQRHQQVEELNSAIDSFLPSYKLSPKDKAGVVKSLFHWMERFNNPQDRLAALEDLAHRYNIDLTQPPPASYYDNQSNYEAQQQAQLYQQEQQYAREVQEHMKKQEPTLASYAKSRPHFEQLRGQMRVILAGMWQSGAIPPNADLSKPKYLDMAYNAAAELAGLKPARHERAPERKQHGSQKIDNKSVRATIRRAFDEADRG